MTTLHTLVPSKTARRLAQAAADQGLTVNELNDRLTRKALAAKAGVQRVSPEQWSAAAKGLDWLTMQATPSRKRCSSCGALVRWVLTAANRQQMMVDPLPTRDGNLELRRDGPATFARVIRKNELFEGPRYRSHFATCPYAPAHRSRRSAGVTIPRGLGLPRRPTRPVQPDGRRWPSSRVMCRVGDGYLSQELAERGVDTHALCTDLPPTVWDRLAGWTTSTTQETRSIR